MPTQPIAQVLWPSAYNSSAREIATRGLFEVAAVGVAGGIVGQESENKDPDEEGDDDVYNDF